MAGDSVFRNHVLDHGDRELPEMAANGTGVTAVGLTKSGTSMAAPAAAGVHGADAGAPTARCSRGPRDAGRS